MDNKKTPLKTEFEYTISGLVHPVRSSFTGVSRTSYLIGEAQNSITVKWSAAASNLKITLHSEKSLFDDQELLLTTRNRIKAVLDFDVGIFCVANAYAPA